MKNPKLSIAVPIHDMENGDCFLRRLLDSLWNQTFQNFEIVITDNADHNEFEEICEWYKGGIRYFKNPRKGMAQNTNEAIKRSEGEYIKILYMDDYMAFNDSLAKIVSHLSNPWLVTACTHSVTGHEMFKNHYPTYSDDIKNGNNTIGSPSVLTIKNDDPILFDEEMQWLLDCDYYHRLHERYGPPTVLDEVNVVIGLHNGQATHLMGEERKQQEHEYIKQKYA